ncbi:MAG: hypothetical protein JSR69_02305 [Proteobacteria bacterium]|nr:hypothetical protein [Pseudomonadota bacterium]
MKRQHILGAALLLTLVASWWAAVVDGDEERAGMPARGPRAAAPAAKAGSVGGLELLDRRPPPLRREGVAVDLFAARSFEPPPPAAPPPPPPSAPALPFRYLGMLEEDGRQLAFLAEGDTLRVLHAGEQMDARYRVTAIRRDRIDFLYLPLNQIQSLATGAVP